MAQFRTVSVVCPSCNKKEDIRLWEEINAEQDITAKNKILNGEMFQYRCKKCGYTTYTAHNCIYKDPKKNLMIYLAADGDVEGMSNAMDNVSKNAKVMAPIVISSIRRIVLNTNSFREKILIFDNNLDDRMIELLKQMYVLSLSEDYPELQIRECYFCIVDNKWKLELITDDGRMFSVNMDKSIYDEFEEKYRKIVDEIGNCYVVDEGYAMSVFDKFITDNQ